jgi:vitamin B12 transporter
MSRSPRFAVCRRALAISALPVIASITEPPALADELSDTIALQPIVVTPTRLPLPESEVASSITVITADEIERKQERTLSDVLSDVPGLNVVQTGGPGSATAVFMRGTNPNQVKVLLDGIDVGDPSAIEGTFNFEHILTSDIARVEVLRGPQSALYGANAIGGVINIITKKGSGPAQLTAGLEGGSFGTFNQNAGVSGSVSRFNYAFDVAHFHSSDTSVTPNDLIPPGRSLTGNSYDNKTVSTKLGADVTDNLDLDLVARLIDTALDFTADDALGPESQKSEENKRQLYTRGTAHLVLFDGILDQTLGLAYAGFRQWDWDPNMPAGSSNGNGDRLKLDWQGNVALAAGQVLTLGAEHELDKIATDVGPVSAHVNNDAGFVQLQSSFGPRFFNALSLRYDDNEQFGGKVTYRIAPAILIPETGTRLKATYGTAYNPPTLVELYQSFPAFDFLANPNLKPETSTGYDAGFEQAVLGKIVQFGATYFHNDTDNLITINAASTSYANVGKATSYGVESFVAWQVSPPLSLRADYTYTIANDDILKEELLRRPRHKASLDASYKVTAALTFSATLLYVGPWVDVNRAGTVSDVLVNGYSVVNIAGSYDFGHGVTGFARIDNLLDRHYQDPLGFERPGLGVFAGVRIAFDTGLGGGGAAGGAP